MSRKSAVRRPRKVDRRVRRTRDALGDALLALIQENRFEDITVQQVLDRAGVGRSTFYKHYQDKQDLFLSDLEDFFETFSTLLVRRKEASRRVAPVREFFAHVDEMKHLHSALAAADKLRDFQEMAQEYFARAIQQRLQHLGSVPDRSTATAQALAGALLSVMSWWLQSGAKQSPEEMDELYHWLVWGGIGQPQVAATPVTRPPRNQKKERRSPRA
ncbi:MAG TPA: TetR/AcrR family transcriptional regulator [Terriglobales bacterium]|nr:TetR/AcrR family transcriptional regulator [Terriglobales bacterium]